MNYFNLTELILDESPNVIYLSDIDTYQIYYMNKTLHSNLGFPSEEVWQNTPCYKLLQGKDEPCHFCTNKYLKVDIPYKWTHYNELLSTWYDIIDKKIEINGKNLRLEIAHDSTEIMQAKEKLRIIAEEEQVLVACAGLLHSSNVPEKALQKLLDLIAIFYKADRSYIFDIDKEKKIVTNSFEARNNSSDTHLNSLRSISLKFFSFFLESFKTENILYIHDLYNDEKLKNYPRAFDLLKAHDIKSLLLVPITAADGEIIGLFGVDNPTMNLYSKDLLKQVSYFVSDFKEKQSLIKKLNLLSYTDSGTSLHNPHKYVEDLELYEQKPPKSIGVAFIDMNGLKEINDTLGHEAGNELISSLGKILHDVFKDNIYRTGGDEFVALVPNCREEEFKILLNILQKQVDKTENLSIALGSSWSNDIDMNIREQISISDSAMYNNKKEFYSSKVNNRRKGR